LKHNKKYNFEKEEEEGQSVTATRFWCLTAYCATSFGFSSKLLRGTIRILALRTLESESRESTGSIKGNY